jgi:hypothetical protein
MQFPTKSNDIHHRDLNMNPKVYLKAEKIMNSQGNIEQKEQHWRYHNTQLQTVLQSQSKKNNMALAEKQI